MSFFGGLGGSMPYTKWNELNEDWILDTVKKLSEDWARYHADWEAWKNNTDQAFQDLHDYVMNYFAELDLTQEVSDKINQMAEDGSLAAIIQPLFDEYKQEITNIVGQQNSKINVLEARMDEFASLPDGSTTGDAELQDIRASYTGVRYPTAGDAVRAQAQQLFDLTNLKELVHKLIYFKDLDNKIIFTDNNYNVLCEIDEKGISTKKGLIPRDFVGFVNEWDFAISDLNYNILAYFDKKGNLITKKNYLNNKKISILGDSISTYEGTMPEDYVAYYPSGNVNNVNKTWWKQVIDTLGLQLLSNASWSGSSVADEDDDPNNNAKIAYSDARVNDLSKDGATPDIIIVLIGTNDFARGYQIGDFGPTTEISDGSTSIRDIKPAYACMLNKIRRQYPNASVYCCTLVQRHTTTDTTYPIINSAGIALSEINRAIKEVATWQGAKVIELDKLFSLGNISDYTIDGRLHPNSAGMKEIASLMIKSILEGEEKCLQ